jgi:hypothetical protein
VKPTAQQLPPPVEVHNVLRHAGAPRVEAIGTTPLAAEAHTTGNACQQQALHETGPLTEGTRGGDLAM